MKTILSTVLDPTRRSNDARDFEGALRRKIVGQDQAVEAVANALHDANPVYRDARAAHEHPGIGCAAKSHASRAGSRRRSRCGIATSTCSASHSSASG